MGKKNKDHKKKRKKSKKKHKKGKSEKSSPWYQQFFYHFFKDFTFKNVFDSVLGVAKTSGAVFMGFIAGDSAAKRVNIQPPAQTFTSDETVVPKIEEENTAPAILPEGLSINEQKPDDTNSAKPQ